MIPILNHLHYLEARGENETGTHQSRKDTKLIYISCGCVVMAEHKPDAYLYRHYTVPCTKHTELRKHNFKFNEIADYQNTIKGTILVDKLPTTILEFLEVNYFCLTPENQYTQPISEADAQSIMSLSPDQEYNIASHAGYTTIKRIS